MQSYICPWMELSFYGVLGIQKVKIHEKFDFLPLFWVAESSLGRIEFWLGKWPPNPKIPVGLKSRLRDLSNELSCTQFWHREVPQTELQSARPVELDVRDPLRELCQIWPVQPRICSSAPVWLAEVDGGPFDCTCGTFWILLLLFYSSRSFSHVKG